MKPNISITLDEAERMIAAGRKKATEIKVAENIAVVDAGGNLLAFQRMDGAWLGSINIAMDKAWTARAFDMTTEQLGKFAQPGQSLFGIQNQPRVLIFGGGAPVKRDGAVVGAVGASGGTVEQDIQILEAALSAFK